MRVRAEGSRLGSLAGMKASVQGWVTAAAAAGEAAGGVSECPGLWPLDSPGGWQSLVSAVGTAGTTAAGPPQGRGFSGKRHFTSPMLPLHVMPSQGASARG